MTQISKSLKAKLDARIEECLVMAEKAHPEFNRKDFSLTVTTSLYGRGCVGIFTYRTNRFTKISANTNVKLKFHAQLLIDNVDSYLKDTVSHEVAHLVAWSMYTRVGNYIKPHGREWKSVMHTFGVDADVQVKDGELDMSNVGRNSTTFDYTCGCRTFQLSKIRHNRIQRGAKYICPKCKGVLARKTKEVAFISDDMARIAEAAAIVNSIMGNAGPSTAISAKPRKPAAKGSKFEIALMVFKACQNNGQLRNSTVTEIALSLNTNFKNASTYYSRCAKV